MTRGTPNLAPDGPKNPTDLAVAFYRAWEKSGRTLEAIAEDAGCSVSTVWAYCQGTRGGEGRRSVKTIRAIAAAMGMDPEKTVRLARVQPASGTEDAILADPYLTRRDKEILIT